MTRMLILSALADPTRRRIVELLAAGELRSGEIAGRFQISAPAISQHLKVLKQARLVRVRVEAQHRLYQLDPAGFTELDQWLHGIRHFWHGRLDALQRELRKPVEVKSRATRRNRRHGR